VIRHLAGEGLALLGERPLVSAGLTLALAIALAVGGLSWCLASWFRPLVARGSADEPVAVLLRPGLPESGRRAARDRIAADHPRWRVRLVPRDELAARLARWFPYLEGLLDEEGEELLPPLLEVTAPDPAEVTALLSSPAVLAVGPTAPLRETLARTARLVETVLAGTAVALAAVAFLLAAIWVHLELYRHADEIGIMRLVGAEESAVRGPYLVAAAIPGLIAGAIAAAATAAAVRWAGAALHGLGLPPLVAPPWLPAAQVAFGVGVPVGAAALTLVRHAHLEVASP